MSTCCFKKLLRGLLFGAAFTVAGSTPALADNPADFFDLNGTIVSTSTKPDWADIFQGNLPNAGATPKTLPANFSTPTFLLDFTPGSTADASTYTTGSKDTLNISTGWQCNASNNVSDKVNINNAYAVAYTNPADGHLIVYFGMDVQSNLGTKDVGFWFLKDPKTGCVSVNKAANFTGNHSNGDILIVSQFTNGGSVSTIVAYEWENVTSTSAGDLNPNPIGSGGQCNLGTFDVCAMVNSKVLTQSSGAVPWLVNTKPSGNSDPGYSGPTDLDIGEFFEGGIDLTALHINGCFNRYLADTRSSTSLTATLFDYALGNFSNCSIGATKVCGSTVVNTSTNNFTSTFTTTITNTSTAGSVFDVSFNESANAIPANESCTITSNTGDQNVTGTALTNGGTPVKVASSLASGASVTVGISCTGPANGFQNMIHATAGSVPGQSDIPKDATSNSCSAAVNAGLQVEKSCQGIGAGITLQGGGSSTSPVTLTATVHVKVTNPSSVNGVPSNEQIQIDTLTDVNPSLAGTGGTLGNFTQVSCSDYTTAVSNLVLPPGSSACFKGTYTPTTADLGSQTQPGQAFFTDQATATAHGLINTAQRFTQTSQRASCFLCDSNNNGTPDVLECVNNPNCGTPANTLLP